MDDVSFVVADLPGLIEGAAHGAGLGIDFLRHIERCRLLIHVVDLSPPNDAVYNYDAINAELAEFSPELVKRPQIVAANKADIWEEDTAYQSLIKRAAPRKVFAISTATRQGVDDLVNAIAAELAALPPIQVYQPEVTLETETPKERDFAVRRDDSAAWVIESDWLHRVMRDINFGDYEQRQYFDRLLRKAGVFDMLEARGISEGDTVRIFDLGFEYVP
jgi:GTP-binding protein